MKRLPLALVFLALSTSFVFADAISDRQDIMDGFGKTAKTAVAIAKGATPFDAAQVKTLMQVYIDGAAKMPTLFPDNSKTGGDTTAGPKIWSDPAGFKKLFAQLSTDATAAAATTDAKSFGAAFGKMGKDCGACHGAYRTKD